MKNILILYSELSGYTANCLNYFAKQNPQIIIHVIKWPINNEAPFKFKFEKSIRIINKNDVSIDDYLKSQKIKLIICCGWFDKEYIKCVKKNSNITSVLMFDNYWKNTLKQRIGKIIIPKILTPYFNYCWVPGEIQKNYALKLGFESKDIFKGFYATNLTDFNKIYKKRIEENYFTNSKKMLYVGRYLKLKGVLDLWKAFINFSKTNPDWELHCVGNGDLYKSRVIHEKIFHHGFIQPEELSKLAFDKSVFIMPSHFDHWGMAVQEFAASGLPLICSDKVGSINEFLKSNKNGFSFKAKSVKSLELAMHKISNLKSNEIREFGDYSHVASKIYNIKTWTKTLNRIIHQ
tara:strand:- start:1960 stop:3003 length:1044 start_codon:yes stop_codon:yes gene_type:complete